ncbi:MULTISPECIES: Gfo/Idh/MocA family protein [Providencia]|uniref:Gfo/Idh/MocA family protein n=1 Tax=Providencia TaxID=586 RepID=UPI00234A16A6|nr:MULTISPECIES: Gfo/Idh/MocA family oxidoreductase [unclassified Providencia]
MRLAIIGCGNIVRKEHIPALCNLGVSISALCDISISNIYKAKLLLNYSPSTYICYRKMIDEIEPDTIIIALPHELYEDIICYCCKSNVTTIIKEKPFALNVMQARKLKDLIIKNDMRFFTVCQKRYTLAYEKLKECLISTGEKASQVEIRYTIPSKNPNSDWRGNNAISGGGVWLDMGYHIVNLVNYLFDGDEISVNYSRLINTSSGEYDVDDIAFVELQCRGVIIFIYISCVGYKKHEDVTLISDNFIIYGNKYMVQVKSKKQKIINEFDFINELESPFVRMYREILFSDSQDGFNSNLVSSLAVTDILEVAFKDSGYKVKKSKGMEI